MKTRRPKNPSLPANGASSELFLHHFQRPELLTRALTHRSLSYETNANPVPDPNTDNEQLEFIGDAVLGLLSADALFQRFPGSSEGELTRLRASLVSSRHLASVATRIGLGALLRLGRGEDASGGRRKPALLANALEAVIAALYLDGGLPAARTFVETYIIVPALPDLNLALRDRDGNQSQATFSGAIGDHKSALQEHLQAIGAGQPQYILTDQSGPDHAKRFRVQVHIELPSGETRTLGESEGSTKKQAQQEAARIAFQQLTAEQKARDAATEKIPEVKLSVPKVRKVQRPELTS